MTGGLLQLVAYGKQDRHLIGSPQITFFKMVYKRHTNFSIESRIIDFKENLEFGKTLSCVLPRNGDLINNVTLQVELPILEDSFGYVNNIGHALIEEVWIEIGSTKIDLHYGDWMNIWSELTTNQNKKNGLNTMLGKVSFTSFDASDNKGGKYMIPIYFWFCGNNGLSLPIVALQYHDVELKVKIRPFKDLWVPTTFGDKPTNKYNPINCNFLVDYIYLDNSERKKFAQDKHEYLIKQLQINKNNFISEGSGTKMVDLNFNHPVTELIWVIQRGDVALKRDNGGSDWFNYSDSLTAPFGDPLISAQLKFNGTDRTIELDPQYLRLYQPYMRHTSIPDSFIYVYSFALNPELSQPTGSCNFSRFDSTQLILNLKKDLPNCSIKIYATNYNILRIMCGLGGLAYID